MNNKLYLGNLPYTVTEQQIQEKFTSYGEIGSVSIFADKGFGFLEMKNADDANKIKEELNGQEVFGRKIRIDFARPKQKRENTKSFNRY